MTAEVIPFPSGGRADDTIRRTVAALMRGKGISADTLSRAMGVSRATFFNKLGGHGRRQAFKGGEIADLAVALGVTVAQLYDGLGGTFAASETEPDEVDARPEGFEPPTFWSVVPDALTRGNVVEFPVRRYPMAHAAGHDMAAS